MLCYTFIMCNLYRLGHPDAEVARMFSAEMSVQGNAGGEVYPGYPGLVVAEGRLRSMTWGFPLRIKGKSGQLLKPKPVNNARSDKLGSFMWRASFADRRCLIPVGSFAEAEGEKGRMTRTWLSLPDQPVFACAGIWRDSDEWGPVYSMVMTEAAESTRAIHDRMPVILRPEERDIWTNGTADQARALCRPYTGEIVIDRTSERWRRG